MCLIALNWNPDSHYPLILIANRDEFYQRPAREAHFWEQNPDWGQMSGIFGGLDLQAGGSWLAVNRNGKLAAITNYREPNSSGERSRGELVSHFLQGDRSAQDYLLEVQNHQDLYAGFNLLLADNTGLWYFSNRERLIRKLKPGLYGLSNGLLDTPWPKVQRLKALLEKNREAIPTHPPALIDILHDQQRPGDDQLPDTGIGLERERLLSTCFIQSPIYGTRNSTALILNREGTLHWHEQHYDVHGAPQSVTDRSLQLPTDFLMRST